MLLMAGAFYSSHTWLLSAYRKDKHFGRLLLRSVGLILLFFVAVHAITGYGTYTLFSTMEWPFTLESVDSQQFEERIENARIFTDIAFVCFYIIAGFHLRLIIDWFRNDRDRRKLENERLKAELRFLKAQISPHFLFNTLNSLYALASINSDQTAPAIMQLSDIMRYMLYECNVEKVALSKEVEYLKALIELQKIRLKDNVHIHFDIEGNIKGRYISPLLLVIAVENSFKHGVTYHQEIEIRFQLIAKDGEIHFIAANPLLPKQKSHEPHIGGIGLHNLEKRLELLYPNRHQLSITSDNQQFIIHLILQENE